MKHLREYVNESVGITLSVLSTMISKIEKWNDSDNWLEYEEKHGSVPDYDDDDEVEQFDEYLEELVSACNAACTALKDYIGKSSKNDKIDKVKLEDILQDIESSDWGKYIDPGFKGCLNALEIAIEEACGKSMYNKLFK